MKLLFSSGIWCTKTKMDDPVKQTFAKLGLVFIYIYRLRHSHFSDLDVNIYLTSNQHSNTTVLLCDIFIRCWWMIIGAPQGRFSAQITTRNCLKFMPSLPNHTGFQIDHSRNNAIFSIQFPFSRSKICRILGGGGLEGWQTSEHQSENSCHLHAVFLRGKSSYGDSIAF